MLEKNSGGVMKDESKEERKYYNNYNISSNDTSDNRSKLCGL